MARMLVLSKSVRRYGGSSLRTFEAGVEVSRTQLAQLHASSATVVARELESVPGPCDILAIVS